MVPINGGRRIVDPEEPGIFPLRKRAVDYANTVTLFKVGLADLGAQSLSRLR
jgi:hypothetical protein